MARRKNHTIETQQKPDAFEKPDAFANAHRHQMDPTLAAVLNRVSVNPEADPSKFETSAGWQCAAPRCFVRSPYAYGGPPNIHGKRFCSFWCLQSTKDGGGCHEVILMAKRKREDAL